MPRYLVLIACDPRGWEGATEEEQGEYLTAHAAFESYVERHGRLGSHAALADAGTATTVSHGDGHPVVTDGPFVELTEQIAGYYDVELPDLDAAVEAAALLPRAYTVEIRPAAVVRSA